MLLVVATCCSWKRTANKSKAVIKDSKTELERFDEIKKRIKVKDEDRPMEMLDLDYSSSEHDSDHQSEQGDPKNLYVRF